MGQRIVRRQFDRFLIVTKRVVEFADLLVIVSSVVESYSGSIVELYHFAEVFDRFDMVPKLKINVTASHYGRDEIGTEFHCFGEVVDCFV